MLDFLTFVAAAAVAYFVWRIADQLPDVLFRVAEIQRDVAELRRKSTETNSPAETSSASASAGDAE